MSGNAIAKFFATVEFKAMTKGLDTAVKNLKRDLNQTVASVRNSKQVVAAKKAALVIDKEFIKYKKELSRMEKEGRKAEAAAHKDNLKFDKTREAAAKKQSELAKADSHVYAYKKALQRELKNAEAAAYKENALRTKEKLKQATEAEKIAYRQKVLHLRELRKAESAAYKEKAQREKAAHEILKKRAWWVNQESKKYLREQARLARESIREQARIARQSMGLGSRGGAGGSGAGNAALTGGVGGLTASGAGGGLALGAAAFKSYNVGNFMVSREPQFEFLTGDATKAADAIKFVDSEAKRLSLNLVQANDQYKQLLASGATSIGIPQTEKLFSRFSELSTMLGLSEDAQARGVRAFGQIDFVW